MTLGPKDIKRARKIFGLTQLQASIALGNIRPETVSRWERSPKKESLKLRGMNATTTRHFVEAADLLEELYPKEKERIVFLEEPQKELGGNSPIREIMDDPPYGLREVVRLLGRMVEGITT